MPDPFKPFKPKDIQELIDLFDNDEVTTAIKWIDHKKH